MGHNCLARPCGPLEPGLRWSGAAKATSSTLPAVGATRVVARLAGEGAADGINETRSSQPYVSRRPLPP